VRLAVAAVLVASTALPAAAQDTDADGLSDADEQSAEYQAMGADPAAPDLFVQADWQACDPVLDYCGPNNSFDAYRMSSAAAFRLAAYFAPDVRVHVDNGVPTRPDDAAKVHGAWGGAKRQGFTGPFYCNSDVLGARWGKFHRGVTTPINSGGGGDLFGFCFGGDGVRMGVLAQELGHNFGIGHGGNFESYPANCKPHYRSPMNYAYTYDRALAQFSRGAFTGVVLNPTRMDELAGLGTDDPAVLDMLRASPWLFNVRDDGAVDWNRDGRFQSGLVRATPTWAFAGCEQSTPHSDALAIATQPSLAWLPDPEGARMYVLTRGENGKLQARFATRFDRCDPFIESQTCADFAPEGSAQALEVPGSRAGGGFPAAVGLVRGGEGWLYVVYPDEGGATWLQRLHVEGGAEVWDAPAPVSGEPLAGDAGLVALPGEDALLLVAPAAGGLAAWRLDLATGAWSGPTLQTWEDGAAIAPCQGVALATGFQADLAGEQVYALVPQGPFCTLELARRDAATGRWSRFPATAWLGARPMAGGRPGLAYAPFDPTVPEEGRFYLAWRPLPAGAALISLTEGNDPRPEAMDRRLRVFYGTHIRNSWAVVGDGVSLLFDRRFDQNLRASYVYAPSRGIWFHPFADGIIDVDMRDQDDYAFIVQYLACSLTGSCSP
jgi:hypothetical protein